MKTSQFIMPPNWCVLWNTRRVDDDSSIIIGKAGRIPVLSRVRKTASSSNGVLCKRWLSSR